MKTWHLAVIVALAALIGSFLGATVAHANHNKVIDLTIYKPIGRVICSLNKANEPMFESEPDKDVDTVYPCLVAVKHQDDGFNYLFIEDYLTGDVTAIWQFSGDTTFRKLLWRIKPKGQLGV